jgi:hypothetical protein
MYQILIDNRRSIGGALRSYYSVWRDGRLVQLATRGSATPEQAFHAACFYMEPHAIASVTMPREE